MTLTFLAWQHQPVPTEASEALVVDGPVVAATDRVVVVQPDPVAEARPKRYRPRWWSSPGARKCVFLSAIVGASVLVYFIARPTSGDVGDLSGLSFASGTSLDAGTLEEIEELSLQALNNLYQSTEESCNTEFRVFQNVRALAGEQIDSINLELPSNEERRALQEEGMDPSMSFTPSMTPTAFPTIGSVTTVNWQSQVSSIAERHHLNQCLLLLTLRGNNILDNLRKVRSNYVKV